MSVFGGTLQSGHLPKQEPNVSVLGASSVSHSEFDGISEAAVNKVSNRHFQIP